ncbi:NAD(P)-binding protein [Xylariaceae sp. FL0255]|nr:NAD(P)-binding protein [Xylariaceae sp. FL0255]
MSSTETLIPQSPPWFGTEFAVPLHSKVPPALGPENQPLPSSNFVVVITGASRGIGKSTAELFAKAGASGLILTARTIAALEETKKACLAAATNVSGIQITTLALEAGVEEDARRLGAVVREEYGRLVVLVNNAGLANYIGRFLTMQALLPLLLESPQGARMIINVTSECSHFTGFGPLGFNISALASNRLTEAVAERCENLLFFSVHPGMVPTTAPLGMAAEVFKHAKDSPELCGAFCLWLVRKRPTWLSGRYMSAKWDVEDLEKKREEIVSGDKLKWKMVV